MTTKEIPRSDWKEFLDSFSREHEGWQANLEVLNSTIGAQKETRNLPLEGISLSSKEGSSPAIAISMGKEPDDHVTHTIPKPTHVWLEQTSEAGDASLEIESEAEGKTLLRFRSALPADMVDGVVLEKKAAVK